MIPRRRIVSSWILSILCLFLFVTSFIFAELANDGSFENNPTAWEEFFSTSCNPTGIGDWSGVNNAPDNYDGQQTLWVGGTCGFGVRNNGARQAFALQENAAILSFWFNPVKFTPDPLNIDQAIVSINNEEIWRLGVNGLTNPTGWNNALIDISQYANQTVTLSLQMQQNNDLSTANVFFDYIEFLHPGVTINQAFEPTAVLPGETFDVVITVENNGETILNDLTVSNTLFTACNRSAGSLPNLAPGETTTYTCEVANASADMENTATVQAITTEIEYLVEASQTVEVPVTLLTLTVSPDDVSLPEGEQAILTLTLTNEGNITLTSVQINSTPSTGCTFGLNQLTAGDTAVFACTFAPDQSGQYTFVAIATDPVTGRETSVETAVNIELLPPPNVSIFTQYVPVVTNNLITHSPVGEPNNVCNQAFPISLNQAGQFFAEDVHDWYHFTLNATSNMTINLTNFVPVAGQITVWRGSCQTLTLVGQNGDFATTKTITLANQPAENYFIWIINDGQTNNTDKYSLIVNAP